MIFCTKDPEDTKEIWLVRLFYLANAAIGLGALSIAFFVEYVLKILPCTFCIYERVPFCVLLVLGIMGAIRYRSTRCRIISLSLILVSYLTEWCLSAYHVLLEHKILPAPAFCGGLSSPSSFADLKEQVLKTVVVPCDRVSFTLLDFSLTEWNLVFATGMIGVSAFFLWFNFRKQT